MSGSIEAQTNRSKTMAETTTVEPVRNKRQQVVVPVVPQAEVPKRPTCEEAEKYIREAGWVHVGTSDRGDTLWADPAAGGGDEKVTALRLESKDGGEPVEVKQTRCPPAQWDYPLMEAMQIQRLRDRATKVEPRVVVTNK